MIRIWRRRSTSSLSIMLTFIGAARFVQHYFTCWKELEVKLSDSRCLS
jgi:hypothetical protein